MGAFHDLDFDGRDVVYYGEVIQDGLLDMLDANNLDVASATSLALTEDGMNRLFDNSDRYEDDIILRPASLSNRASLIDRFGVVAINSALEVDIYGHVNSTHVDGTQIVSGIGGSGDFARNGLISIIALPSIAANGEVSRIVPMVPHTDHTEHDVDVIITEHGVADLRSSSPVERAERLVTECTHPSFRDKLQTYVENAQRNSGHIPHDFERTRRWLSDHPS